MVLPMTLSWTASTVMVTGSYSGGLVLFSYCSPATKRTPWMVQRESLFPWLLSIWLAKGVSLFLAVSKTLGLDSFLYFLLFCSSHSCICSLTSCKNPKLQYCSIPPTEDRDDWYCVYQLFINTSNSGYCRP